MGRSSHHRYRSPALVVAVVVVLLLAAAACSGDGGSGGNGASSAGGGAGPSGAAGLDTAGRCDLGFNTAAFNDATALGAEAHAHHDPNALAAGHASGASPVDFTLEQWAGVFVDESLGMSVAEVVDAVEADDVYRRHVLQGVLTHTLTPDPWAPMTDTAACDALAGELGAAQAATARYPTVADARADGYTLGDWYNAGLGVHYQNFAYAEEFDPGQPAQLLYDGTDDDARLVGVSYVVSAPGDRPPAGFTGDNDLWHRHARWCLDLAHGGVNLGTDVLSDAECEARGGSVTPNPGLWMLHTWVVPGCESDWGMFSGANPRLPYLPDGVVFASGCGSGKTLADPLDLDARGRGPALN